MGSNGPASFVTMIMEDQGFYFYKRVYKINIDHKCNVGLETNCHKLTIHFAMLGVFNFFFLVILGPNSKNQFLTKLTNSNCDKTQKPKLWQNSKTQIVTKLNNLNCDKTQKLKMWQITKMQTVTNLKTQIVTKLKNWNVTKLKNTNCDKTQQLKFWQNSKT